MKKIFLSLTLFLTFTAYALYTNIIGSSSTQIAKTPQSNKSKNTLILPQAKKVITDSTTKTTPPPIAKTGKYRDGNYTGSSVDAYYGNVQVMATISGGKISDVQFLDYPQDRNTSVRINSRAIPYLTSEAISIQDSKVNAVSGASFTSAAFRKSLASALSQAKI